jgi:TRAP-type C4-dicarboxylate transport system permease small subunit
MQRISAVLTALTKRLDRAINVLLFIFLLIMSAVTFAQVCTRYLLGFSIVWGEELCRYLFIWSIFIAVPVILFRGGMTSFDMLYARLKGVNKKIMHVIISMGEAIFLWLLYQGGYPFVLRQWGQVATSIPVSMALVYAVVPISACLGMFVVFERLLHMLCANTPEEEGAR